MRRNNLRRWRHKLRFTQTELAGKAKCSRMTISLIEKLNHYPTQDVRTRLSTALGVSSEVIWPELEVVSNGK